MNYAKILQDIEVPYLPNDPLFSFNYDGSIECRDLFVTGVGFNKYGNLIIGISDGNFYFVDEIPYFVSAEEAKSKRDCCRVQIEAYRTIQENNHRRLDFFMAGYFLEDEASTIEMDKNFVDYAIKKYPKYLVPGVILRLDVAFPGYEDRTISSYYLINEDLSYVEIEISVRAPQNV